jgi:hypothetical protein
MAQSIRISDEFYELAQAVGARSGRSLAQQLEYWARLGARIDMGLTAAQAMLLQSDLTEGRRLLERLTKATAGAGDASPEVAARHARYEAEVLAGGRDAASLLVIPEAVAKSAQLVFPEDAFGGSQSW